MIYELKKPIEYTKGEAPIKAIEFREPLGKDVKKLFRVMAAMTSDDGALNPDMVDAIIDYTKEFSEAIGQDVIMADVVNFIRPADVLGIAQDVIPAFLD